MPHIRRLIINADDLGLARSVNRGIAEALAAGNVRSASLMVNMPASSDAAGQLAPLRARGVAMSIGLHFNIVMGAPLSACSSLRDARTGRFRPLLSQLWRAWLRRADLREVETEFEAQLARAEALLAPLGLRVTHVDSHRHTHCLPGIADVVRATARRHGIAHVRRASEVDATLLGRPVPRLKSRALRAALGTPREEAATAFAGIALMASPTFARDILALLAVLPAGTTELMVHPGYDSPELAALDSYRAERERELRALTSPELGPAIQAMGISTSYFEAPSTTPPG
ncbi:MAG: ChbG/HpnK family deacetylase [Gemmatimonadaceae bacterium]